VSGGRGSGKTRTGAETLGQWIAEYWDGGEEGDWAVVAPTFGDARDTCMEGPSGLLRVLAGRYDPTRWNRSMGQLHLDNGATIFCDGANDGALRIQGKNLRGAWADEVGLWRITLSDQMRVGPAADDLQVKAWDESLMFAVRIAPARIVATGTPKQGHPLVRKLLKDPAVRSTRMHMRDNIANLAPATVRALEAKYGDTALGRQELAGEFIDEVEGAYWKVAQLDASRLDADDWQRIQPPYGALVVGVDPPGGATEAGIVAAAISAGRCLCETVRDEPADNLPHAYILADHSLMPSGPNHWASVAINTFHDWDGSEIVGESNYGGDMVINTISMIDSRVPVDKVTASRGKLVRAEPIAGLFGDPERPETWQRSRAHIVGRFPDLESEMTSYTLAMAGKWSPNRLDAMVWAVTRLGMDYVQSGHGFTAPGR